LALRAEPGLHAAALRYFERQGVFADAVCALIGAAPPAALAAAAAAGSAGEGELLLAWSRPTETLVFTTDVVRLAELQSRLAGVPGGCCVDLSGGLRVLRVTGERVAELLCRLGSACVPRLNEARRSRLAEVPVLALCVQEGETLLAVDRAYAPHLMGWIRETLADFQKSA
ncbi:MAG: hypothetical protein ACRETS_10790, partial [Steroidobacteraceae bacterium]